MSATHRHCWNWLHRQKPLTNWATSAKSMQTQSQGGSVQSADLPQVAHAAQAVETSQTSQRQKAKRHRSARDGGHTKIRKTTQHTSNTGQQSFIKQTMRVTPPSGGSRGMKRQKPQLKDNIMQNDNNPLLTNLRLEN